MKQRKFDPQLFYLKQNPLQLVRPSSTIAAGADSDSADKWWWG